MRQSTRGKGRLEWPLEYKVLLPFACWSVLGKLLVCECWSVKTSKSKIKDSQNRCGHLHLKFRSRIRYCDAAQTLDNLCSLSQGVVCICFSKLTHITSWLLEIKVGVLKRSASWTPLLQRFLVAWCRDFNAEINRTSDSSGICSFWKTEWFHWWQLRIALAQRVDFGGRIHSLQPIQHWSWEVFWYTQSRHREQTWVTFDTDSRKLGPRPEATAATSRQLGENRAKDWSTGPAQS